MKHNELLDQIAIECLGALIKKTPFFDTEGKVGVKVSAEELREIKKGLCETAYEYASLMLIERQKSHEWLKENQQNGHFSEPKLES